jgi:hypothetical protein
MFHAINRTRSVWLKQSLSQFCHFVLICTTLVEINKSCVKLFTCPIYFPCMNMGTSRIFSNWRQKENLLTNLYFISLRLFLLVTLEDSQHKNDFFLSDVNLIFISFFKFWFVSRIIRRIGLMLNRLLSAIWMAPTGHDFLHVFHFASRIPVKVTDVLLLWS